MKPLFASITVVMIAAGPSAAADLIPWGEAGAWKIYVDPEHANGCLTEVVFDDGTFLRLGFRDHEKKAFLSSYHPGWKAFKPELPYRIAYMIDDTLFEGEGRGIKKDDVHGIHLSFDNPDFLYELAKGKTLTFLSEKVEVVSVDLTGSYEAVSKTAQCDLENRTN